MRRRAGWASLVLLLGGCAQVEPSGGLFEPAPGSGAAVKAADAEPSDPAVAATPTADGGFDFEADGRDADDGESSSDGEPDLGRLAAGLGIDDSLDVTTPPATTAPPPAAAPPTAPPPTPPPAPVMSGWEPGTPLDGSFGVRLVSTVVEGTPPRAILGMPDGSEVVVKPGTMLAEHQLVVLAIGRNAVQVAEVVPSGDHARVTTQVLSSLYPAVPQER